MRSPFFDDPFSIKYNSYKSSTTPIYDICGQGREKENLIESTKFAQSNVNLIAIGIGVPHSSGWLQRPESGKKING